MEAKILDVGRFSSLAGMWCYSALILHSVSAAIKKLNIVQIIENGPTLDPDPGQNPYH
jgi:hypothetical protein